MTSESDDAPLDPALVATLATLNDAAGDPAGKPWSLPKIAKRTQLPMSTLRRVLTQLDAAGLSATTLNEDGSGSAALTAEGRVLCAQLFGANDAR
ncbi:transcriptional regulator [Burkholderia metallica]|uniref:Transcriptional regulator n=1 Tax=Burkholderia metallica TaxID=488729 RepID=A0ABT8P418_9BURK|nr:transcriptional regulator [Burkholderia metallica]AOJ35278.1 transcriptional regulator [Burkholderia metallica]MDN7929813.1 transcriptional regulator [Burkholderia metallica]VWB80299.1 transcriptional regulator [Burkholderia metallica]